jgi:hypothetical protein
MAGGVDSVKLCNEIVTVFNARVDPDVGGNVWTPTVITGASWWATDASTVDTGKGGLVAVNKVISRIPEASAPDGLTLKNGDILVKGDASEVENPTPAKLKALYGADCATILGITDNRRAPNAPHWRVTAT